jgi:hypothetical protein
MAERMIPSYGYMVVYVVHTSKESKVLSFVRMGRTQAVCEIRESIFEDDRTH